MSVTEETEGQMSKQSGWMKRQDEKTEDLSIKVQYITRQFMIDTLQMTLREELGWGYDRIMRISNAWEENRKKYHPAIDPRDKMADVMQEKMQRAFKDICANKRIEPIPFKDRYPYLKDIRYDIKYK